MAWSRPWLDPTGQPATARDLGRRLLVTVERANARSNRGDHPSCQRAASDIRRRRASSTGTSAAPDQRVPPSGCHRPGAIHRVPSTGCRRGSPPGTSGRRLPPASSLKLGLSSLTRPAAAFTFLTRPHRPTPQPRKDVGPFRSHDSFRSSDATPTGNRRRPPHPRRHRSTARSQTTIRSSRTIHTSSRSAVTSDLAKTEPSTARSAETPRPSNRTRRSGPSLEPAYSASPQARSAETTNNETAVARRPSTRTGRPARTKEMRPTRSAWRDPPILD